LIVIRNAGRHRLGCTSSPRRAFNAPRASRKFAAPRRGTRLRATSTKWSRDSRYLTCVSDDASTLSIITSRYMVDVAGT
jgi:hypothetical protein